MCKMRVALNQLVLGNRELGWELFDGKQSLEMTSRQVTDCIKAGEKVCGLTLGKYEQLELDKEGFYTTNMTIHSHIGNYRVMNEDTGMSNLLFVCIGKHEEAGVVFYDCISNRFEQRAIPESDMKVYLKLGLVSGGAKLDGENIVLASLEYEKEEKTVAESKAVKAVDTKKATDTKKAEPKKTEKK